MPVNEAAGTPSISIPLYEVHSGQLTLPLTLTYHASGIRVTDAASSAGLGWALNAGGVITRVLRGGVDEGYEGFSSHLAAIPRTENVATPRDNGMLDLVARNVWDFQPDLFTFNALGQSGSFLQGNDGQYHCLPQQVAQITRLPTGFRLVDAAGTQYWFGSPETSSVDTRPPRNYTSAWYLDRVVSADLLDTLRFEYDTYDVGSFRVNQSITKVSEVIQRAGVPLTETFTDELVYNEQSTHQLRRILFRNGTVELKPGRRLDVPDDQRLASVTVLARDTQDTVRHVVLYHSYFAPPGPLPVPDGATLLRLRLDSVRTFAPGIRLPAHVFTYNTQPLPDRLTGSRDHWGYANGAPTKLTSKGTPLLIPTQSYYHYSVLEEFRGADRQPHPEYVQAGILTGIRYPTGGEHQFVYEPNTVAQRRLVPNPRMSVSASRTGPGAPSRQCNDRVQTFQVPEQMVQLRYIINASRGTTDDRHNTVSVLLFDHTANVALLDKPGVFVDDHWEASGQIQSSLDAGHTYSLQVSACGESSVTATLSYEAAQPHYETRNEIVGGIRLREQRIRAAPTAATTIKRYYYATPGTALSSGVLLGSQQDPLYAINQYSVVCGSGAASVDCWFNTPGRILYTTLTSSPVVELTGGDRVVAYEYVTVVDSSAATGTAGKTVSRYTTPPDVVNGGRSILPAISNAWRRDDLLTRWVYATPAPGRTQLLTRTENEYRLARDTVVVMGFSAGYDANIQTDPGYAYMTYALQAYQWANTRQRIGWKQLARTRQYRYAPNDTARYQLTTTTYTYANARHQQPTAVTTTTSDGGRQLVRSRYAADYDTAQAGSGAALAVRELLRTNRVAYPLEQTTWRLRGTDSLLVAGSLTLPQRLAPRVVAPHQQLRLRLASPRTAGQFRLSTVQQGVLRYDAAYQPDMIVDRYDTQARIAQYHVPAGTPHSVLWDPLAGQPMADGAAMTLEELAYTSFEDRAPGTWSYAAAGRVRGGVTGQWAYALAAGQELVRNGLAAGTYQLHFWATGAPAIRVDQAAPVALPTPLITRGAWRLYQLTVPVRATIRLTGSGVQVDDVRLHPVGRPLTTYTYDPLRGQTSQTDPAGRTATYEYDALGRLLRVRDEQGRILTEQEYKYALQP